MGQAYPAAYTDADAQWPDGARTYRLGVPADPPAKLFRSATVYDIATRRPADTGSRTSASTDRWSRTSTAVGGSATSPRSEPSTRPISGAVHRSCPSGSSTALGRTW
ncbi:DUF1214 domain-containing protein [Streptomyces sp. NPDC002932]|uniref:DUF1214 domain-containing protein n=1 Tax=Streptomyces sp. NPDC002932 TaxID=3364672 RepID=UPI00369EF9EE